MTYAEFGPFKFDGSLVETYERELCLRLRHILDRVLDKNVDGIGALARPEANIGIIQLLCILHRLDGDVRWIEEAVVTYIRTLDWVLRNSTDICWRFEWESPISEDPIFKDLFSEQHETSLEISTLLSTYRAAVGDCAAYRQTHELMRLRVEAVKKIAGKSPVVLRNPVETDIPPLPDNYPSSCCVRDVIPAWPSQSLKYRERVGGGLLYTVTEQLGGFAWLAYVRRKILSNPEFAAGGDKDPEKAGDWVFGMGFADNLVGIEFYNRLLGTDGSAEKLLSGVFGASVFQDRIMGWTGRIGDLDSVFTALLVGDSKHLRTWARLVEDRIGRTPKGVRSFWASIKAYIDSDRSSSLSPPTIKTKVYQGMFLAFSGLLHRDAARVKEGIRIVLDNYCRSDFWSQWSNTAAIDLCIPAIALQRAALRDGIALDIPDDEKNDRELVLAPDPTVLALDYCPFAGTDLVLEKQELPWLALFLGRRVVPESQ